ncbi:MAG: hypothetical protein M3Z54_06495 [Gemmatimonadota bacterium]|nr:hypothetical protein [Gemmatimonadota bacterium]
MNPFFDHFGPFLMFDWFRKHAIQEIAKPLPFEQLKRHAKIVVLDDEKDSFPTELLQNDGYTIEWWSRLDAAKLHRLEKGDFDIIILDIQGITDQTLSDTGDGLGVLRRLKSVNPYQIVVAFSGKTYDLDSVPFWKLADETIRKPVSVITCKEVIDRLIREHISVRAYWDSVEHLLQENGVPPDKVKKLENRVVKSAKSGSSLYLADVQKIVGSVKSIVAVVGAVHKIVLLWQKIF